MAYNKNTGPTPRGAMMGMCLMTILCLVMLLGPISTLDEGPGDRAVAWLAVSAVVVFVTLLTQK